MLQVFSGLIFLCHVNFSSPPAFHTHSQYDLPPWSHSIVFSSNFLPLPLHSSLTLSKFSPFCSTFCFEPWLFPEEPSTDTLPHFPAILRSFEYLLRRRKSPLFSDLLRFLFFPYKAWTRMAVRLNLLSVSSPCRAPYHSYHYFPFPF